MKLKDYKNIIWDWNGTLLNDLDFCIATINSLLGKRKLPLLDRNSYKANFTFPVKDYYAAIGFDFKKEAFEIPAREFIDKYDAPAFDPEAETFPLAFFEPMMERVFAKPKKSMYMGDNEGMYEVAEA